MTINTPEQRFIIYYDKLRDELNTAFTNYEICKTIREKRATHRSEYSEAITFFTLIMNATLFSTVMSINRFIDSHRDSLHLDIFFKYILDNLHLFSTEAFRNRLTNQGFDKEYCDDFSKLHKPITAEIVTQDKKKIENLSVNNLKVWRDKQLAHIEKNLVTKNIDIMRQFPVTIKEIDDIISTLHEMLNRYRVSFDGVEWVLGLPSTKPQIEFIFNAISHLQNERKRT